MYTFEEQIFSIVLRSKLYQEISGTVSEFCETQSRFLFVFVNLIS